MAFASETAWINTYEPVFRRMIEEAPIGLKNTCDVRYGSEGEDHFFDFVKAGSISTSSDLTETHSLTDDTFERRRIDFDPFYKASIYSKDQMIKMGKDPVNILFVSLRTGYARKVEKLIITAATGTAHGGKLGSTAIPFPAANTVAATGTGGTISYEDVTILNRMMYEDNIPESQEKYLVLGPKQHQAMLNEEKAINSDYGADAVVVRDGRVRRLAGFNVYVSNQLDLTGTDRTCLAYAQNHIGLWIAEDVMLQAEQRKDKHYSTQLYTRIQVGATRLHEEGVYALTCTES